MTIGTMVLFFLCWIAGEGILFLLLKNKKKALKINDILITLFLSTAVGFVAAFAAYKANFGFWLLFIAFAGVGALITYKFLDKSEQVL